MGSANLLPKSINALGNSVCIAMCTLLTACTAEPPSRPLCRFDLKVPLMAPSKAGCMIRVEDKILTLTLRPGRYLDIPHGLSSANEPAQCTAHRATWEKTGFNVEVGQLLGTGDNGLRYFACYLDDDFAGELSVFPVPTWAKAEIGNIQLIDPFMTGARDWQSDGQMLAIRRMFNTTTVQPQPTTTAYP